MIEALVVLAFLAVVIGLVGAVVKTTLFLVLLPFKLLAGLVGGVMGLVGGIVGLAGGLVGLLVAVPLGLLLVVLLVALVPVGLVLLVVALPVLLIGALVAGICAL